MNVYLVRGTCEVETRTGGSRQIYANVDNYTIRGIDTTRLFEGKRFPKKLPPVTFSINKPRLP